MGKFLTFSHCHSPVFPLKLRVFEQSSRGCAQDRYTRLTLRFMQPSLSNIASIRPTRIVLGTVFNANWALATDIGRGDSLCKNFAKICLGLAKSESIKEM